MEKEKDLPKPVTDTASAPAETKVEKVADVKVTGKTANVGAQKEAVNVVKEGDNTKVEEPQEEKVKSPMKVIEITTSDDNHLEITKNARKTEAKNEEEKVTGEINADGVHSAAQEFRTLNVKRTIQVSGIKPTVTGKAVQMKSRAEPFTEKTRKDNDKKMDALEANATNAAKLDFSSTYVEGARVKQFREITKKQGEEETQNPVKTTDAESAPQYYTVVKNVISQDQADDSEAMHIKTEDSSKQDTSTPSIRIKTVNVTNPGAQDQPSTSKVVMHLPGGIIQVSDDQNIGIDLVRLLEKSNTQVTEVQQLPRGMVCYAFEQLPVDNQEDTNQDVEKVRIFERSKISLNGGQVPYGYKLPTTRVPTL